MTKKLSFGQTPWDDMSRDDLLREVQRMASALVACRGALHLCRLRQENHPFWLRDGTGAIAVLHAEAALATYDAVGDEACYCAFFRYANCLLFPEPAGPDGPRGWFVCDGCGRMTANTENGLSEAKQKCPQAGVCQNSPMRPIAWDDLRYGKWT